MTNIAPVAPEYAEIPETKGEEAFRRLMRHPRTTTFEPGLDDVTDNGRYKRLEPHHHKGQNDDNILYKVMGRLDYSTLWYSDEDEFGRSDRYIRFHGTNKKTGETEYYYVDRQHDGGEDVYAQVFVDRMRARHIHGAYDRSGATSFWTGKSRLSLSAKVPFMNIGKQVYFDRGTTTGSVPGVIVIKFNGNSTYYPNDTMVISEWITPDDYKKAVSYFVGK